MQLWSDLDNLDKNADSDKSEKPQGTPPSARRGRARRLSEEMVFASLRQWLLDDYIPAYCRALAITRIYRRCYFLDALGLSGSAKKSGILELVQSLHFLSQTLARENGLVTFYGFVFEQGSSAKRGKAQREITLPEASSSLRGSWLDASSTLLAKIEQLPTIFLLNPFGQRMFDVGDLNALFKRTAPSELCLLFSYKQVETYLLAALQSTATATALSAVLRTDKWKALPIENEEQREQAIENIIDLFMKTIQRHFVLPVQRITLPVYLRPAVVENAPYALLFATRRQDSLICMNDALCRYNRRTYEQGHRGVLAEEWFIKQQQERYEAELLQLRDAIARLGSAQRIRRWPDLRQQVMLEHFGQFLLQEYDDAIRMLLASHTIACEWRRKAVSVDEQPVPGNHDVLTYL